MPVMNILKRLHKDLYYTLPYQEMYVNFKNENFIDRLMFNINNGFKNFPSIKGLK